MKTLDQQRATNAQQKAYDCRKRDNDGNCLPSYPGLIISNGLLSCLAYSLEKSIGKDGKPDKDRQWWNVANAIAYHLAKVGVVGPRDPNREPNPEGLRYALTDGDSLLLRQATEESLAFLAYLKRFAKD